MALNDAYSPCTVQWSARYGRTVQLVLPLTILLQLLTYVPLHVCVYNSVAKADSFLGCQLTNVRTPKV